MLQVLDGLKRALNDQVTYENWRNRLSRQTDLRARFDAPDLTVRQDSQWLIITVRGQEITLPKAATDDMIADEIAKTGIERPMPTIAEQVKASTAMIAEVKARASTASAQVAQTVQRAVEEVAKIEKQDAELNAELAGLNGGEPL